MYRYIYTTCITFIYTGSTTYLHCKFKTTFVIEDVISTNLCFNSCARNLACSLRSRTSRSFPICVTTKSTCLPPMFSVAVMAGASSPVTPTVHAYLTASEECVLNCLHKMYPENLPCGEGSK